MLMLCWIQNSYYELSDSSAVILKPFQNKRMQISYRIQWLKNKMLRMSLALVNTDLRKIGFSNKSLFYFFFPPVGLQV